MPAKAKGGAGKAQQAGKATAGKKEGGGQKESKESCKESGKSCKESGKPASEVVHLPTNFRTFKPETEIWIDQALDEWLSLEECPSEKLIGGPSYKLQNEQHKRFCEALRINRFDGNLGLLYEQWELPCRTHAELLHSLLLTGLATQARADIRTLVNSFQEVPVAKVALEASHGRGGFLGAYMFKIVNRTSAALAFAVQVVGTR